MHLPSPRGSSPTSPAGTAPPPTLTWAGSSGALDSPDTPLADPRSQMAKAQPSASIPVSITAGRVFGRSRPSRQSRALAQSHPTPQSRALAQRQVSPQSSLASSLEGSSPETSAFLLGLSAADAVSSDEDSNGERLQLSRLCSMSDSDSGDEFLPKLGSRLPTSAIDKPRGGKQRLGRLQHGRSTGRGGLIALSVRAGQLDTALGAVSTAPSLGSNSHAGSQVPAVRFSTQQFFAPSSHRGLPSALRADAPAFLPKAATLAIALKAKGPASPAAPADGSASAASVPASMPAQANAAQARLADAAQSADPTATALMADAAAAAGSNPHEQQVAAVKAAASGATDGAVSSASTAVASLGTAGDNSAAV